MYILQWAYFLYRHNQQLSVFNSAQKAMYKRSSAPCDPIFFFLNTCMSTMLLNLPVLILHWQIHAQLTETEGGVGGGGGTRKGLGWRGGGGGQSQYPCAEKPWATRRHKVRTAAAKGGSCTVSIPLLHAVYLCDCAAKAPCVLVKNDMEPFDSQTEDTVHDSCPSVV